jgi:uncharacterized protein (DUF58 family)
MPDSKRFLHPEAIKRIAKLDVRARHIVEGYLSGMHRSPYFGQSVEFRQHREYVPGDDLRHVDWKVWARQDRLVVKQFEEDSNLTCRLLVDASASMAYGNGPLNKFEYACTVAACLAYLILKQQDAVGCAVFDQNVRTQVDARTKRSHIYSIIDTLNTTSPKDATDMSVLLKRVVDKTPRRGMVILISDLLTDRDALAKGLKLVRQRGHDVLVLHIMDDDEIDFPFNGPTRFEGMESDRFVNCNPRSLREGYLSALDEHLEFIRKSCARNLIDYALIRTRDPLDAALATYLSKRLGAQQKRI